MVLLFWHVKGSNSQPLCCEPARFAAAPRHLPNRIYNTPASAEVNIYPKAFAFNTVEGLLHNFCNAYVLNNGVNLMKNISY